MSVQCAVDTLNCSFSVMDMLFHLLVDGNFVLYQSIATSDDTQFQFSTSIPAETASVSDSQVSSLREDNVSCAVYEFPCLTVFVDSHKKFRNC
jgi:hypothetical protein